MAYESLTKSQFSVKSDVYAFGITILEIFVKGTPFSNMKNAEFSVAMMEGKIKPETYLPERASEAIVDLVRVCTQQDQNLRPDFEEIVNVLDQSGFELEKK